MQNKAKKRKVFYAFRFLLSVFWFIDKKTHGFEKPCVFKGKQRVYYNFSIASILRLSNSIVPKNTMMLTAHS